MKTFDLMTAGSTKHMLMLFRGIMLLVLATPVSHADNASLTTLKTIESAAHSFVSHLPSIDATDKIEVAEIDPKLQLTLCNDLAFSTQTHVVSGNFRIKAECRAPEKWSIFLSVTIFKPSQYWVLKQSLDSNKTLDAQDLQSVTEYRINPIPGRAKDLSHILGLRLSHAMKAGSVVRYADLSSEPALSRGQRVKVLAIGKGYEIHQEGVLLGNTYDGEIARVQINSKRIISGTARTGGIVEAK